mmetsp:Transcript_9870/g.14853  ORF Transcript_9870/g.14853 Transcript_9870/m.14853 type:complete len:142 (+) Transcript_9870:327-752(+)|eukprot:CAMPEP_0167769536 /NCGR_PEP_ID=MMETSP0110_2-20121227/17359_1 /TAXON_ID=629695 /ORGANISM="Gymnochlora sp., Strain CCMP2014" /LENGTH=141 /DNA_ID=CAMNT_0007658495 /DNA_START=191 /DNA_END=616 /DNA_ORIENTATION=+
MPEDTFRAIVIHPFEGKGRGELKLSVGDIVKLHDYKEGKDWWSGTIGGEKGRFPSYFVRRSADIPDNEAPEIILKVAKAIKEFKSDGVDELSLSIGDIVCVTASGEGWYVGCKMGTTMEKFGIFPMDHVSLLSKEELLKKK